MARDALTSVLRFGVAASTVLAALAISLLLQPHIHSNFFPLFLGAIMVSGWYGGLGPSMLATALSTLAAEYFLIPPLHTLHIESSSVPQLAVFVLTSLLIGSLNEQRRRAELLAREHEARELAEKSNRVKDEFLATLSHELRTPLNAIIGWTEMLRRMQLDQFLVARAVDVIDRNAKSQARLIEDLLDASRIITGKLRLEMRPVELAAIIDAAIDSVRPMAEAKGVQLEKQFDSSSYQVSGDSTRLQQVVLNLLSNAIKFTPGGGRVEVKVKRVGEDSEVTVSDTGKGISPEFLPHIFDRFSQADSSRTRRDSGLGLGLAIVRHLVELHGGAVEARSAGEGEGSSFTVRLPLAAVSANSRNNESATETSKAVVENSDAILKGLKILLVDDHADTRDMMAVMLCMNGAEIRTAATAREAFESLNAWKPDVLVSDIGMPDEDGYALIRKIRSLAVEQGGTIPALALTGYAGPEEGQLAIQSGYQMHLAKPTELTRLVSDIVGLAGARVRRRGA